MLDVTVIGVGGTGSYLVPPLARMLNSSNFHSKLTLIDYDLVEMKNIDRQNFIISDLGYYKCDVLQRRYSSAFHNVEIKVTRQKISDKPTMIPGQIIISCVDSIESRKAIIYNCLRRKTPTILIDSGNEDQYGHVTITFFRVRGADDSMYNVTTQTLIDVISNKIKTVQGSCATLGEQTLIQNNLQASVILKMLLNLTNITVNTCDVSSLAHPLDQLTHQMSYQLADEFMKNDFIASTYYTGSLSSKHDTLKISNIDFVKKIRGNKYDKYND